MEAFSKEVLNKNKKITMKHIKKFKNKKEEGSEISFDAKSLEVEKTEINGLGIKSEPVEHDEKELTKLKKNKVEKFESFITINIDNIENVEWENEFDAEYEEDEGCGCCSDCSGQPGCDCGCEDCMCDEYGEEEEIEKASDFVNTELSENLKWHLKNYKPITENIFRPGSTAFYELIEETRRFHDEKSIKLTSVDKVIFETTDIGKWGYFKGEKVPLDLPMENISEVNEAKHHGKKVRLNYPTRSSGPKKYKVYVKNPKTGKIKCVNFGDVKGGLTSKVNDPKARKAFAERHKCAQKKDKTKAGYWACRLPRYKHLVKTDFSGYW
jgi:hypothetical protein